MNIAGIFQAMCYDDIKNFGRLFRVWILNTPQITIAAAEYAEKILQGMQHHTKSSNYRFLHAWMGHGLLTSQGWFDFLFHTTAFFLFNVELGKLLYNYVCKCNKNSMLNIAHFH
jgi:hypothetical protein